MGQGRVREGLTQWDMDICPQRPGDKCLRQNRNHSKTFAAPKVAEETTFLTKF